MISIHHMQNKGLEKILNIREASTKNVLCLMFSLRSLNNTATLSVNIIRHILFWVAQSRSMKVSSRVCKVTVLESLTQATGKKKDFLFFYAYTNDIVSYISKLVSRCGLTRESLQLSLVFKLKDRR